MQIPDKGDGTNDLVAAQPGIVSFTGRPLAYEVALNDP